jgi:outer membrane protein assembly factor BamB
MLGLAAGSLLAQGLQADPNPPSTAPLWRFRIPDAQPAQFGMVDAGQLYASSYNGHVYQFDLKSGALRNDWNVSSPYRAYSAPRMVDGRLYVYTGDKCFYRLDRSPARAVRLANFSSDNKNQIRVEALAYDPGTGLFFLGTGENVHAVNTNGVKQWTLPHPNKDWAEPMSCDGMLYLFDTTTRRVCKYDPANPGNALWSVDFAASASYLSKGVDGDGDTMIYAVAWQYTTTSTGRLAAIYDGGPLAGTKKWDIPLNHAIKHVSLWEGKDILVIPAMNDKVVFRPPRRCRCTPWR